MKKWRKFTFFTIKSLIVCKENVVFCYLTFFFLKKLLLYFRFDIYRKVRVLRKRLYSYYQLFITLLRSQILFWNLAFLNHHMLIWESVFAAALVKMGNQHYAFEAVTMRSLLWKSLSIFIPAKTPVCLSSSVIACP